MAAAEIGTLGMWLALEAYLVAFTAPPAAVIVLFSLPVPLFLWLFLALRKTTVLEVDAAGIRQTRGTRLVTALSFQEVGSVEANYDPALRASVLKVRDRKGKSRLVFVSSPRVSAQDVQFLYQSIAARARSLGIPARPWVELPSELQLPLDEERIVHRTRPSGPALARIAVACFIVFSVPLLIVRALLPAGGQSAGLLYLVLLFAGMVLVFSPRTRSIRKWAMKTLGFSKPP